MKTLAKLLGRCGLVLLCLTASSDSRSEDALQPVGGAIESTGSSVTHGFKHGCKLEDLSVHCWGAYQMSSGVVHTLPAWGETISLPGKVVKITSGYEFTCALVLSAATSTYEVYCWGYGGGGALGQGVYRSSMSPVRIASLSGATDVQAGTYHVCSVVNSRVYCWGVNASLQLGSAQFGQFSNLPVLVPNLGAVRAPFVVAGNNNCAQERDTGRMMCWGLRYGEAKMTMLTLQPAPAPEPTPAPQQNYFGCLNREAVLASGDSHIQLSATFENGYLDRANFIAGRLPFSPPADVGTSLMTESLPSGGFELLKSAAVARLAKLKIFRMSTPVPLSYGRPYSGYPEAPFPAYRLEGAGSEPVAIPKGAVSISVLKELLADMLLPHAAEREEPYLRQPFRKFRHAYPLPPVSRLAPSAESSCLIGASFNAGRGAVGELGTGEVVFYFHDLKGQYGVVVPTQH